MSVYIDRDKLEDFAMNCVGGMVTMKQIHEFPPADKIMELITLKALADAKIERLEARLEQTRWIPVTERLPEHEYGESTSVLTVDLFGVMRVTYFDGGNWCWPSGEALTTMRVAPITHWMQLPAPPEEVEP